MLLQAPDFARLVRMCCAGLLVSGITACGTIPTAQFEAYASAYQDARDAGLLIYDEIAPSLRSGEDASPAAAFTVSLGPHTYSRSPCAARFPDLPSVQARCDLMYAVAGYHEVLARLNQGASAAAVKARLGEVSASLGALTALSAIPSANAVIAPVSTLLGPLSDVVQQALTLAERAELKAKLEQAAPTITKAVTALEEDVKRIHEVQRAAYVIRLRAIEDSILGLVNPVLRTANTRDRPTEASARIARRALDQRFDAMFSAPEPEVGARLSELPRQPSGSVMTAQELSAIDVALDATEPELAHFQATVDQWHAFLEALYSYDDMLAGVRESLDGLLEASRNPFVAGGGLQQFDDAIRAVRRDAQTIRAILAGG